MKQDFKRINIHLAYKKNYPIQVLYKFKKKLSTQKKSKSVNSEINNKKKLVIKAFILQRKEKAKYISNYLRKKFDEIYLAQEKLINRIIKARNDSAIKIQSYIRMRIVRKHFKDMLFSSSFVFFYTLNENLLNNLIDNFNFLDNFVLFAHIYHNDKYKYRIEMKYSPYLCCYYFCLSNQTRMIHPLYKVRFSYNNNFVIDTRYPLELDGKGKSFNIITRNMFYKRIKRPNFFVQINSDEIPKLIKKSNSDDSIITNTPSSITEEITPQKRPSILKIKNTTLLDSSNKLIKRQNTYDRTKKVSFNKIVETIVSKK